MKTTFDLCTFNFASDCTDFIYIFVSNNVERGPETTTGRVTLGTGGTHVEFKLLSITTRLFL